MLKVHLGDPVRFFRNRALCTSLFSVSLLLGIVPLRAPLSEFRSAIQFRKSDNVILTFFVSLLGILGVAISLNLSFNICLNTYLILYISGDVPMSPDLS